MFLSQLCEDVENVVGRGVHDDDLTVIMCPPIEVDISKLDQPEPAAINGSIGAYDVVHLHAFTQNRIYRNYGAFVRIAGGCDRGKTKKEQQGSNMTHGTAAKLIMSMLGRALGCREDGGKRNAIGV
jgi:hypothetical protein